MRELAVVVISRNEERRIGRCIESVLATADKVPESQVLLVDSASSDGTCAIARQYPISIVQLHPDWRLTASAGRYIGTLRTDSEYILFVDGDMVLQPNWIALGLAFMHAHPEAAALSGEMDEVYLDGDDKIVGNVQGRYGATRQMCVRALGGVGLYRRSALDQAGTFNPFIPLREEAELALRLRRAGYSLHRIPEMIATHYSPPRNTLRELKRRNRAGYYVGFGHALAYTARNHLGLQFLREQGLDYIYFAGYLLFGLAGILGWAATGAWQALALWMGLTILAMGAYSFRKHSLAAAALGYITRALMIYGATIGVVSALRDPPSYPTDVLVIAACSEPTPPYSLTSDNKQSTVDDNKTTLQVCGPADHGCVSL